MQQKLNRRISSGTLFFRRKLVCTAAIAGMLSLSAFTFTLPTEKVSFPDSAALLPSDSLRSIDHALKEQLLAETRRKRYADSLTAYALTLRGIPYRWGGKSLKGFDCSGFVAYVFEQFNFSMERSSRYQSKQGTEVPLENLKKGDLLFFTGTNPKQRRVGHVGIVVSATGEEVEFVHSSSYSGVKVSKLDGYYQTRFMTAKRLLDIN